MSATTGNIKNEHFVAQLGKNAGLSERTRR